MGFYRATAAYADAFETDCIYETCKAAAPLINHHTFMGVINDKKAMAMEQECGRGI